MEKYFTFSVGPEGVAELVLDEQGAKVNKLSSGMMEELEKLLDRAAGDGRIKAMVLKSAKKDVFIAGADLNEIIAMKNKNEAMEKSRRGQDIMTKLERLPFPTVAVIDGACLGGGLELALACRYRLVSDGPKTRLGLPETTLGIIPGFGGTKRLPRLIGASKSFSMIASGRPLDGPQALKSGLADGCYPPAFLYDRAAEFVKSILGRGGAKKALKARRGCKWREKLIDHTLPGQLVAYSAAVKEVRKKTRGFYPAPVVALKTAYRNLNRTLNGAMKAERRAFGALAVGDAARRTIGIFFTGESLKKDYRAEEKTEGTAAQDRVSSAAVLGAGKMGGSIAWLVSNADVPVLMKDISWDAVGSGYAAVREIYNDLVRIKKLDERRAGLKWHKVTGTVDYGGFKNADFIIEAIVEDIGVKTKAFGELERIIRPDAIIATNTSSLSVDEMAGAFRRPERFIGMHFFNPVPRMPLVEVVPGAKTSRDVLLRTVEFARRLGKTPIVVRDCNGFLVNRVLMAYLNEAVLMLEEGAGIAFIDRAVADFGMPMGPLALLDEIGIKVGVKVARVLSASRMEGQQAGKLFDVISSRDDLAGKSAGRGFYLYKGRRKKPNPLIYRLMKDSHIRPGGKISAEEARERCVLRMINEAALCVQEGIIDRPDYLDMAMILGAGFPPFRGGVLRYADDTGIVKVAGLLEKYADRYGRRFEPAKILLEMRDKKKGFYQ